MEDKWDGFLNAGILFNIAKTAYETTKSAPSDRTSDQRDALIAIVFSAATLEAFIMELAFWAKMDHRLFRNLEHLKFLSDIIQQVESYRGSTKLKYLIAKFILTGKMFSKGTHPYQDMNLLFNVRDAIIHLKPEKISNTPKKILCMLRAKNICAKPEPKVITSWLSDISTRAVARWA